MVQDQVVLDIIEAEKKIWNGQRCIYKIPTRMMIASHRNAFKPLVVAFGPYHHGDPELKAMESHKQRVLVRFLRRSGKTMETCIQMLGGVAEQMMNAYDSLDPEWSETPAAFLELMITDGCFMLELLRDFHGGELPEDLYAENDPIFGSAGSLLYPNIVRDMAVLENQLPIKLILTKLLCLEGRQEDKERHDDYILKLVVDMYGDLPNPGRSYKYRHYSEQHKTILKNYEHVLDVCRTLLILGSGEESKSRDWGSLYTENDVKYILPISATNLRESGIKIRKSSTDSITDISFQPSILGLGGVLRLPQIYLNYNTEFMFLNLVAFERCHPGTGNEVMSYLSFMDDIIQSAKDVEIIMKDEVIVNGFGSEKAVASWFNALPRDMSIFASLDIFDRAAEVTKVYNASFPWWRRRIIHKYFSTDPWIPLLRAAGIIFFVLTLLQTIFTILQNYKKN